MGFYQPVDFFPFFKSLPDFVSPWRTKALHVRKLELDVRLCFDYSGNWSLTPRISCTVDWQTKLGNAGDEASIEAACSIKSWT